jgi:hypothetical protein
MFWPEHWMAFLDANKLLGLATGVERREAKLVYAWSQVMGSTNPVCQLYCLVTGAGGPRQGSQRRLK